jgi:magnesium-protoporphyrin O-methyltransferase
MASCCGISRTFDRKRAEADLRHYRLKGPDAVTRRLLDALHLPATGADTLLDVGSGVGIVAFELLESGVGRATLAEASEASLAAAGEEADRRGVRSRIEWRQGNFVDVAPGLEPADVVVLNRVICCYPDMKTLVERSANMTRRVYAAVYPREAWWVRLLIGLENLAWRLQRNPFRTFVHPEPAIEAELKAAGLRRQFVHRGAVWVTAVWVRSPPARNDHD